MNAQTVMEQKLAKGKAAESKADRMAGVVARSMGKEDQKAAPKAEDQKAVPVKGKAEDQKDAPAKPKKKESQGVKDWKAINDGKVFDEKLHVKILRDPKSDNPKTRGAAERFAMYEGCKTVGDYVKKIVESKLASNRQAHQDVRWDAAHLFIEVK
jgi:hypothetical protein